MSLDWRAALVVWGDALLVVSAALLVVSAALLWLLGDRVWRRLPNNTNKSDLRLFQFCSHISAKRMLVTLLAMASLDRDILRLP